MKTALRVGVAVLALGFVGIGQVLGATRTWTGAVDGKWSTANNWNPSGVLTATDALTWDASSVNNKISTNDFASLSVTSLTFTAAPDGIVLNGSNLTLTAATPIVGAAGQGKAIVNMDLTIPATAEFGDLDGVAFNGVISGAGTSFTTRGGAWILSGSNTFSGNVVMGLGIGMATNIVYSVANIGVAQSLGTGNLIQFGGGALGRLSLVYVGPAASTDKGFQIGDEDSGNNGSSGAIHANGTGPLTWNGVQRRAGTTTGRRAFTLGGFNTDANTWQGSISNNVNAEVGLVKEGRGKWVVTGANAFTNNTSGSIFQEGVSVNSGTLVLDYANNAAVISPSNRFRMQGGTLELSGNAAGVTQSFSALRIMGPSGLSTIRLNDSGASGISLIFSNAPSVAGTGYAALLDQGHEANRIVLGVKLPGTTPPFRYLSRSPEGRVDFAANADAAASVTNLTSKTDLPSAGSVNGQYILTNSQTAVSGLARLIRIEPATANQTLTLNMTDPLTNTVVITTLFVGSHDFTITQAANQKGAYGQTVLPTSPMYLHHFGTGKLTLDTKLGGDCNSTSTLSGGVIEFYGTGLIDWTRPANTTNTVLVAGVTLRQNGTNGQKLDTTATGLGSGNIMLANGGLLEVSDATVVTRNVGTGSGAIQWLSDGGFSAHGGDREVNLGGAGATVTWGATGFVPVNNALVLCSAISTNTVDFRNPVNLAGMQRVVSVNDGGAAVDARLSGVLQSSTFGGGLVKEGDGTLELTAANTYNGETWVKAGTLRVSGTTGTGLPGIPRSGVVTVFTNAAVCGTGTVHHLTLAGGGKLVPYLTGSGVPSRLRVTGVMDITQGTLDLSGLPGPLPDGHFTLAECGSVIGAGFASVVAAPSDRAVVVEGNAIVLRDNTPQGFLLFVR